jgi:hypothetical protein
MELSNMTIESPEPTNPRQIEGYESIVQFGAADYAATVQLQNEGYYAVKYWTASSRTTNKGYYWLANKKQALNNAAPSLVSGKPMPNDAPQLLYLTYNAKITFWRKALDDTVSYTFYGRKRPDFLQESGGSGGINGIYVSEGTDPPCEFSASDIQFVAGEGIELSITCPVEDGGVVYVTITATTPDAPDYLLMQDGYILHGDHFQGANGWHFDAPLRFIITEGEFDYDSIMNDYWLMSDYYNAPPEEFQVTMTVDGSAAARYGIIFDGTNYISGQSTSKVAGPYGVNMNYLAPPAGAFVLWTVSGVGNTFAFSGTNTSTEQVDSLILVAAGTLTLTVDNL